jgi:predicted acyl esterase
VPISLKVARLWAALASLFLVSAPARASVQCREATPAEAALFGASLSVPGVISPKDGTCFVDGLRITASDGVQLTANVFLPAGASGGGRFPAVVFPSSWASADFFEYVGQQHRMAREDYIALAYTARGFYGSGGVVGVAGARDVADVSSALDWLLANTPVDGERIGAAGISYGAGLSLLGAAADRRIKAVAAMSGWGDLKEQLYGNAVPNPTWLAVLFVSGALTGRLDPAVDRYRATVVDPDATPAEIAEISAWAAPRSPINKVDALNARRVPVLISKNWGDDMFSPNSTLQMFSRLSGPKKLLLQPGIHGSAEMPGATQGVDNPVFDQVRRWMDRWLKGTPNGIDAEPQVDLQLKFGQSRETLSTWPAPELTNTTFHLGPRGALRWDMGCFCLKGLVGTLSAAPNALSATDSIDNALDTTAATGPLPILSPMMESAGLPVINAMATILPSNGVRYEGTALKSALRLRGSPKLQFRARPSQARGMLVAYLYDVDAAGFGTLITHGARAVHFAWPGATLDFSFELNATAYDVPAGHRLALVFDTADSLYGAPVHWGERFSMALPFSPLAATTMTLPLR